MRVIKLTSILQRLPIFSLLSLFVILLLSSNSLPLLPTTIASPRLLLTNTKNTTEPSLRRRRMPFISGEIMLRSGQIWRK
jgi:hypothetical protein